MQQRLGQTDPLAVAFGQGSDVARGQPAEVKLFNDCGDAGGAGVAAQALHLADKIEKAANRHFRVQRDVLRHIAQPPADLERVAQNIIAGQLGRTRGRGQDAGQHPHGRRLARPVRTQQADDFAVLNGKTDLGDGANRPVALGQLGGDNHGATRR